MVMNCRVIVQLLVYSMLYLRLHLCYNLDEDTVSFTEENILDISLWIPVM